MKQANPGETVRVYLAFLSPHLHLGKVVPVKMFLIREGLKVVAYGRVTTVLALEESARRVTETEKHS